MFLKSEFFFGYYGKLLENIVGVRDEKFLQTGSYRVNLFSEIVGNYWKLFENIVVVQNDEFLQTGSLRVNLFRKF